MSIARNSVLNKRVSHGSYGASTQMVYAHHTELKIYRPDGKFIKLYDIYANDKVTMTRLQLGDKVLLTIEYFPKLTFRYKI